MRKFSFVLTFLTTCLLAGCWQSKGPLYAAQTPLAPFHGGKVEAVNVKDKTRSHSLLTKEPGGAYRLTNDDKSDSDYGESFGLRFFALTGAPSGTMVFEATEPCKADDMNCTRDTALRYYGLVRVTPRGAEIINPDCARGSAVSGLPGVTADKYGVCTFSGRAALDKALGLLAGTRWKPDVIYTLAE